MLAAMAKSPSWAITLEESEKLAVAINGVTQLYDIPMLDERGRAWMMLTMVGAEVYGTRVATAVIEANKRAKARGSVTPIRPQPQPTASPGPVSNFDYMGPTIGANA